MKKSLLRKILDGFHSGRERLMTCIVYVSLWIYGSETTWHDLQAKTLAQNIHSNLNLDAATGLDLLLSTAKDCLEGANKRRDGVLDKCKTLLGLISILLTIVGILTSKLASFANVWVDIVFALALLTLVNSVAMLLVCFGIRTEMRINLEQGDANLQLNDLKKSLVNSYLQCLSFTENRIDYLLEIFKAARFFFQVAAIFVLLLFVIALRSQSTDNPVKDMISQLQKEPVSIKIVK